MPSHLLSHWLSILLVVAPAAVEPAAVAAAPVALLPRLLSFVYAVEPSAAALIVRRSGRLLLLLQVAPAVAARDCL